MTESKICTCPSGDGSLRWPCPAHPAVEQAGGDERAAFEQWLEQHMSHHFSPELDLAKYEDSGEYRYNPAADYWKAWQARAALAQPSPAQAEKAEVERTEGSADLLAIVREAVAGAYNEWKMISEAVTEIMEAHERIVGELRADRDSWAEQAEQRLADWDEMRKERDAALARVEQQERTIAGMNEAHAKLAGLYEAAQAQHSVPEGLAEFSQFLSAVMDAAGLVRYGRRSKELSEYLGAQCMKYRLSAPVAQAQHSGPEEFSFEYRHPNGESHTVTVSRDQVISEMPDFLLEALCSKFCNCEPVGETNVVECCCDEYAEEFKLLAAAPGKEVPQAWLDVQAERRRQVEVEGYHGFRDNHYISYELSKAARAYIEVSWHALSGGLPCKKPESWPWMAGFKWSDGRTMLVKACALALAEIERLDRAAHGKEGV